MAQELWDVADENDFCEEVCAAQWNADSDTIFDCGCVIDEDEGDYRSDFEQAGEWLASAGWGTDEDYGLFELDSGW